MRQFLLQSILALSISLGLSAGFLSAAADVQNLDYQQREVEVTGEGATAEEALVNSEIAAIEAIIKTLVQSPEELGRYQPYQAQLHANRSQYLKRLKIIGKGTTESGRRFYQILFAVEVAKLRDDLIKAGIILSVSELSQQLNLPMIAVYYHDPRDQSVYATWAVERANNFLLAQQYRVVDAAAWLKLTQDDALIAQGQGKAPRLAQVLALKAKADIVIEIQIKPEQVGKSGEFTYFKTPVSVKAYEASSGEPFIVKVYERLGRDRQPEALALRGNVDVSTKAVIEEGVAGVMPLLLEDLSRHWKQNISLGQQYRLVLKNLPAAREAEFFNQLKLLVKDAKQAGKGQFLVRSSSVLGDLADQIEEKLGAQFKLSIESFDLGSAIFVCQ